MPKLKCRTCGNTGKFRLHGKRGTLRTIQCRAPLAQHPDRPECGATWSGDNLISTILRLEADSSSSDSSGADDEGAEAAPRRRVSVVSGEQDAIVKELSILATTLTAAVQTLSQTLVMLAPVIAAVNASAPSAVSPGITQVPQQLSQLPSVAGVRVPQRPSSYVAAARSGLPQTPGPQAGSRRVPVGSVLVTSRATQIRERLEQAGVAAPQRPALPIVPLYARGFPRGPTGAIRRSLASVLGRDAVLAVSFIGRDIIEVLTLSHHAENTKAVLTAMGCSNLSRFDPAARGSSGDSESGKAACIRRWTAASRNAPAEVRDWYLAAIARVAPANARPAQSPSSSQPESGPSPGTTLILPDSTNNDVQDMSASESTSSQSTHEDSPTPVAGNEAMEDVHGEAVSADSDSDSEVQESDDDDGNTGEAAKPHSPVQEEPAQAERIEESPSPPAPKPQRRKKRRTRSPSLPPSDAEQQLSTN
jgi:hypothetical protein